MINFQKQFYVYLQFDAHLAYLLIQRMRSSSLQEMTSVAHYIYNEVKAIILGVDGEGDEPPHISITPVSHKYVC